MNWIDWEKQTVFCMIRLWCRNHKHEPVPNKIGAKSVTDLCPDCFSLFEYADKKLTLCRYGVDKPVCSTCTTHCYQAGKREEIRKVMRFAGPRMMVHHPFRALIYLIRKNVKRF